MSSTIKNPYNNLYKIRVLYKNKQNSTRLYLAVRI